MQSPESQRDIFRRISQEAGGRTGAGSAANMTAVLCWRGRCLAQGKSPQAGGRSWLQQNAGERLKRKSCPHVWKADTGQLCLREPEQRGRESLFYDLARG